MNKSLRHISSTSPRGSVLSVGTRKSTVIDNARHQMGMSLVELMIASVISVFMLGGILKVMSNITTTKTIDNGLTEVQELGRYALDTMADVIRYRGFQGCILPVAIDQTQVGNIDWTNTSQTRSVANDFELTNFSASSLRGYEISDDGVWAPDPAAQDHSTDIAALRNDGDVPGPINGSDVLSIQYASPEGVSLANLMGDATEPVSITQNPNNFAENDIVFVGDCAMGDIFRISADPGGSAPFTLQHGLSHNASLALRKRYDTDAQVRQFNVHTFYVGDTGRRDASNNMVPALFRRDINGNVIELVEGIERLEIRYGEVLSTGNIRYTSADSMSASDWHKVVTVEVGLLARTTREVLTTQDTAVYRLTGAVVTPNTAEAYTPGRYLRKVFTTLVEVRNRA